MISILYKPTKREVQAVNDGGLMVMIALGAKLHKEEKKDDR